VCSLPRSRATRHLSAPKPLGRGLYTTKPLNRGDLRAPSGLGPADEIARLASVIDEMAGQMEVRMERLAAERAASTEALLNEVASRRRAENALRRLIVALEDQAKHVAGALHAEAGQFLAMAHIMLADIEPQLAPDLRERLHQVQKSLDSVEARLRDICHELRPRVLEDLGLVGGLEFLADRVARRTGIDVGVDVAIAARLDPLVETAVYRVVQEALNNIAKHSRARRATIVVSQDEHAIRGSIRDDGCGFDVRAVQERRGDSAFGLRGMQDRLEAVRGWLEIVSELGAGTELRVTIPLEQDDAPSSTAR